MPEEIKDTKPAPIAPVKPVEANNGGKVAADAEAGKAEENRRREADMPIARAEELPPAEPMTAEEAKVHAPVPAEMSAGHHHAQKFGNDPSNPAPADGVKHLHEYEDDEMGDFVLLSRKTPDHPDLVYTKCPPLMVGDYERAGWNRHTSV